MKSRTALLVVCILLMSVSLAQAFPQYTVSDYPGRTGNGGPFAVTGPMNFSSFCLEVGETIGLGGKYYGSINEEIWYNASGDKLVSGVIDSNTAILYNYFLDHESTLTNTQKHDIQLAIWAYQGQSGGVANDWYWDAPYLTATERTIMALNLWTADVGYGPYYDNQYAFDHKAQTLLIATAEPGILILLGIGLVGLAGIRRKE